MVRNFIIFALVIAFGFVSNLTAQEQSKDADQPATVKKQNGKKKKAIEKQKTAFSKRISKSLSVVELSDDQKAKMSKLIDTHFDDLRAVQKKIDSYIGKNRKKMNSASKAAREQGKKWADAMKEAYKAIGLSEEDQKSISALTKERNALFDTIRKELVATFSDEQKAQLKNPGRAKAEKERAARRTSKAMVPRRLPFRSTFQQ